LHFDVFAQTGMRLTDVVWTEQRFLHVENTNNKISSAGLAGHRRDRLPRYPP
jgi:hypothetical protein